MKCAWQAYLNLLPLWMRQDVDKLGQDRLQELRMRLGRPPELILQGKSVWMEREVTENDLVSVVNMASEFSPWTADTLSSGYITTAGGHRLGVCGKMVRVNDEIRTVRLLTSVSVRVARDFPGVAEGVGEIEGSTLIVGSPGTGKTTLLRDFVRQISDVQEMRVAVVDEREEVFPMSNGAFSFPPGKRTEVLSGCKKDRGIEMVLRTMNPQVIAVDEITAQEDCRALLHAGWCGVSLVATAHAADRRELFTRPVYRPLLEGGLFQNLILLRQDKTWRWESMSL